MITTLLMIVLLVVAIVLAKQQNTLAASICAVLIVLLAIGKLIAGSFGPTAGERHIVKAREVMTDGLAQIVADRYPQARVVVLGMGEVPITSEILSGNKDTENEFIKALKRHGLKVEVLECPSKSSISELPGPKEDMIITDPDHPELDPALAPEMAFELPMANAGPLGNMLLSLKDRAEVVVLTVPLSFDAQPENLPAAGDAPKMVLIHHPGWRNMDRIMETTVLDMVLLFKPDLSKLVVKKWPRDVMKAFNQRFAVATTENPSPLL